MESLQLIQINIKNTSKIYNEMEVLTTKHTNKQNNNITLNKQLQRLKIQLNDKLFEINKLEEDYAEQKAKQFIDFQRERHNLNRNIKQLKDKLQLENQQWQKKIHEIREESILDKNNMKLQCQQQIKIAQIAIKQQYLKKFQQQISSLKDNISTNKSRYKETLRKIQAQKSDEIESVKRVNDQIIETKQAQFKNILQNIKNQNEKTIKTLQNIYLCEKNAKQVLAIELQIYIQQNVKQKIGFEHKIAQITEKNVQLRNEITKLNKKLTQLNESIIITKIIHEQSIKELNLIKIKDIQKMINDFNKKTDEQSKFYQNEIQKIKKQMEQICNIYQQKQKKWEERGQMMLKSINISEKKVDSVKTIKKLQFQLMKKDNLLQRQRQSLKNCKLQLQNMEDIYDKMFVTNNYLYKFRSKSFKVKKIRVPNQLNQSNSSIFVEQRIYTQGDKQN